MRNGQFERLLHEIQESRRHTDETANRLRDELRAHTDAMAAGLRTELRAEIRTASEDDRRYFGVIAEGLRADIRLVAEGVATVDAKHERFRREVASEFAETRSMIKLSYSELDRRLRAVEPSSPSSQ